MIFSINRMLKVIEVLYSSSRLLKSQSRVFSDAISAITNKLVRELFLINDYIKWWNDYIWGPSKQFSDLYYSINIIQIPFSRGEGELTYNLPEMLRLFIYILNEVIKRFMTECQRRGIEMRNPTCDCGQERPLEEVVSNPVAQCLCQNYKL